MAAAQKLVEAGLGRAGLRHPIADQGFERGGRVAVEDAEGDRQGPDGVPRRGPLTPPLSYGSTFSPGETEATPRVLVQPTSLQPGVLYNVTVVGYDGATSTTTFSVQVPFAF